MKFNEIDSGRELELNIIVGCDFWHDKFGMIYSVDRERGIAYQEWPLNALKSVLRRENKEKAPCIVCEEKRSKSNPAQFDIKKWIREI